MTALVIAGLLGSGAARPQGAAVSEWAKRGRVSEPVSLRAQVVDNHAAHSETCRSAKNAVRFYESRRRSWRTRMGAVSQRPRASVHPVGCPHIRLLAKRARAHAHAARLAYLAWWHEQYAWWDWMPAKWRRIGACETGYGRQPGDFHWNSGPYQGAFGFAVSSWDAFRLPGYPSEAYLATPRQQLNVALAIERRFGLSGWGCRNA